jgi:hypothetical protein
MFHPVAGPRQLWRLTGQSGVMTQSHIPLELSVKIPYIVDKSFD